MSVIDDLKFTFEEQCFMQIARLLDELNKEGKEPQVKRLKANKHRLFRHNIYEDVCPEQKRRLEKLLCYNLRCLGETLKNNLIARSRDRRSCLSTPTPVRDLSLSSRSDTGSPVSSRFRSPRFALRSRSFSNSSDILQPIKEVITISSDEEELDDDDDLQEYEVKVEREDIENQTSPTSCAQTPTRAQFGDVTGEANNQGNRTPDNTRGVEDDISANRLYVVDRQRIENFFYDELGVIHLKSRKHVKFISRGASGQALTLHVIAKVLKLIESNTFMTKRELYYLSKDYCLIKKKKPINPTCSQAASIPDTQPTCSQQLTQSQSQTQSSSQQPNPNVQRYGPGRIDNVLDDLCCLLGCSKVHLHILTQSKGLAFGDLRYTLKTGEMYDCLSKKEGTPLPSGQVPITGVESNAKFILLIEKDSILQKILNVEDSKNFVKIYKVILVTGKGYPDISTRAFLNFLWSRLKIPILALTDADPHGLEIVCSYKFGTMTTAYENMYISIPQIRWLGILPTDVENFGLPESKTQSLTEGDQRKIKSLLARRYIKKRDSWVQQLEFMRDMDRKAEMEVLEGSTGEYLVETYLPNKLRCASWL